MNTLYRTKVKFGDSLHINDISVWFGVGEVSEVRSLSLAERPCSGSSLASDKIPMIDDDAICDVTTTPCPMRLTDDVIRSKASFSDMVDDEIAADNDDDGPSDSAVTRDVFPAKPPEHTGAASCPPSPPSDVVRTSAEGRTCDGEEQSESDDNMTSASTS